MPTISPKEVIAAVPTAHTIKLPEGWFDHLPDNVNVFESLYKWLVETRQVEPNNIHNQTYAGSGVMKRLLAAESRRIAKRSKLRGEELERAVGWSNLGSGPQELIGGMHLTGDYLIVVSDDDDNFDNAILAVYLAKTEKANRKIRDLASGANFVQWLVSNSGRDDPIGDLVQDVVADHNFPRNVKTYQEALNYLIRCGACYEARECLADAWCEYMERYPDRVTPSAWCAECGNQIDDLQLGVLAQTEFGDLDFYHNTCMYEASEQEVCLTDILIEDPTSEEFNSFMEKFGVEATSAAEIERRLKLWGFRIGSERKQSRVYFIQVGTSGPIKIGFTRGRPEQRLAILQTGQAEDLRLLAEMEGDRSTESDLHQRFDCYRRSREWFDPHPELIQFISVLRSQDSNS